MVTAQMRAREMLASTLAERQLDLSTAQRAAQVLELIGSASTSGP